MYIFKERKYKNGKSMIKKVKQTKKSQNIISPSKLLQNCECVAQKIVLSYFVMCLYFLDINSNHLYMYVNYKVVQRQNFTQIVHQ